MKTTTHTLPASLALALACFGSAHAQDPAPRPTVAAPADACAASFPARLLDAKRAVLEHVEYLEGYERARPALEWFEAHCRFLDQLEITVRRIDDPNAFVCDPKAGRRPKNLTSKLVLDYSVLVSGPMSFQTRSGENHMCQRSDARDRISLVLVDEMSDLQKGEFLCYADDSSECVAFRARLAAMREKPNP